MSDIIKLMKELENNYNDLNVLMEKQADKAIKAKKLENKNKIKELNKSKDDIKNKLDKLSAYSLDNPAKNILGLSSGVALNYIKEELIKNNIKILLEAVKAYIIKNNEKRSLDMDIEEYLAKEEKRFNDNEYINGRHGTITINCENKKIDFMSITFSVKDKYKNEYFELDYDMYYFNLRKSRRNKYEV